MPSDRRAQKLYRLCAARDLPVFFHCGPVGIDPPLGRLLTQVRHYSRAIEDNPDTPLVPGPSDGDAYAVGELVVLVLVQRYDGEGEAFAPRSLDLLRAGGSDSPRALVARVGLDIGEPAFWSRGLDLLEAMVGEAETLAG